MSASAPRAYAARAFRLVYPLLKALDDKWPGATLAILVYLLLSPVLIALAWPGLDTYFWAEDNFWIRRAGIFLAEPSELFRFYGRDFNPMTLLVLTAQIKLLGVSPLAVHGTDLAFHLASGLLLALIFQRETNHGILSGVLAFLWAVSRHTDEAIYWLGARPIALSFFLALMSWNLLESNRIRIRILGYIFATAAILAKETGVLLVPLFTIVSLLRKPETPLRSTSRPRDARLAVLWTLLLAYGVFRFMAARSGHSETYRDEWTILFIAQKFAFLVAEFVEIAPLAWNHPFNFAIAGGVLVAFAVGGGRPGRIAVLWLVIASLPFLPLPKHSPRYALFMYPGFLLGAGALWLNLVSVHPRAGRTAGTLLAILAILYQGYIFTLDRIDYEIRARYPLSLAMGYEEATRELEPGILRIVNLSNVDMHPIINEKMHVAKLNAPITGGFWKIVPVADLPGPVELRRGRAVLDAAPSAVGTSRTLLFDQTGFHLADISADQAVPPERVAWVEIRRIPPMHSVFRPRFPADPANVFATY